MVHLADGILKAAKGPSQKVFTDYLEEGERNFNEIADIGRL